MKGFFNDGVQPLLRGGGLLLPGLLGGAFLGGLLGLLGRGGGVLRHGGIGAVAVCDFVENVRLNLCRLGVAFQRRTVRHGFQCGFNLLGTHAVLVVEYARFLHFCPSLLRMCPFRPGGHPVNHN